MSDFEQMIEVAYEALEGNEAVESYMTRHGIDSAGILTVTEDGRAAQIAELLRERIAEKVVVEIGGGIGLLGCHLAQYARKVYVIEADPMWSSVFVMCLFYKKPKNLTFICGAADELAGVLKADVALFCTHSAADSMRKAGELFADTVIDVYGELLPGAKNLREGKRRL